MIRRIALLVVVDMLLSACGDSGGPDGSSGMGTGGLFQTSGGIAGLGGGPAMNGGTTSLGGASSGGSSSGGLSGQGGSSSGGLSGQGGAPASTGGANGSAGSDSGAFPTGTVSTCAGDACPMGECDNARFVAPVPCSSVYVAPVGPTSTFCAAGASGGYCLLLVTSTLEDWSVNCGSGAPSIERCSVGCIYGAEGASRCGP